MRNTAAPIFATVSIFLLTTASLAAGAPAATLPLERVRLYRSGVAYFEHAGRIEGDADVRLRFDDKQINDILKSMVLLDLDGGLISAVRFASKDPLEKRLSGLRINLAENVSIADLLTQLRGSRISVTTNEGDIEGAILGVETRGRLIPAQSPGVRPFVMNDQFISLSTSTGLRSVAISNVRSLKLLDEELQKDLERAMAVLADDRDDQSSSVDLSFTGKGERRVVVGYVQEAPVWKTSYRLMLPDDTGGSLTLQAWAIIENTTERDWKNVRLSLAAGRPVGFTMDLHQPLYLPRPMLPVPVLGAVVSRIYDVAQKMASQSEMKQSQARYGNSRAQSPYNHIPAEARMQGMSAQRRRQDGNDFQLDAEALARYSASAQARGEDIGEQFHFELQTPLTLERKRSAMVPIINSAIKGRRISIYSASDNAKHPMLGAELTNDTGLHLMPGPISVFDGGAYAGDAQIGHTSRSQERMLSYAVDLDVQASAEVSNTSRIMKIRIVDSVLRRTYKSRQKTTYTFKNNDTTRARSIIIEVPRLAGWDLIEPRKPVSKTDSIYRFEVKVDAGGNESMCVTFERVYDDLLAVTSANLPTLLAYATNGKAPKSVIEAIKKASKLQQNVNDLQAQISSLMKERKSISDDQDRLRRNMSSIDRASDLYARYMKKLTTQEDRIEAILHEVQKLQKELYAARQALDDYLRNLDVG